MPRGRPGTGPTAKPRPAAAPPVYEAPTEPEGRVVRLELTDIVAITAAAGHMQELGDCNDSMAGLYLLTAQQLWLIAGVPTRAKECADRLHKLHGPKR
jgi:hypothetical protein